MSGPARLSLVGGGTLFVDADTPYEQELLFDYLDQYANLHGNVRMQLNRRGWTVGLNILPSQHCSACGDPPRNLIYTRSQRVFCARCARSRCLIDGAPTPPRKPPQRKQGLWVNQQGSPSRPVRATKPTGG